MSQINQITIETRSGGQQTLDVQHFNRERLTETFGEPDRSLGGQLRHNLKGIRRKYEIDYDHTVQNDTIRSIINNILTDIVDNGHDHIFLTQGNKPDEQYAVTPTENWVHEVNYLEQFGKFPPFLEFLDLELNRSKGKWVEREWVEKAWVE